MRNETIYVFEQAKLLLRQTHMFRNFLLRLCQLQCKQSCQKLVHCHAHEELFLNISFDGMRAQSQIAIAVLQFRPEFYLLLQLLGYDRIK